MLKWEILFVLEKTDHLCKAMCWIEVIMVCIHLHVSSLNVPVSRMSDDEDDSDPEMEIDSSQASKNS